MGVKLRSGELAMDALKFGFSNIPLIIKIFWLPALLLIAAYAVYFAVVVGDLAALLESGGIDAGEHGAQVSMGWNMQAGASVTIGEYVLSFLTLLLFTPGAVALTRYVAEDTDKPKGLVHLAYNRRAWLYLAASFVLMLIYYLLFAVPTLLVAQSGIADFVSDNIWMSVGVSLALLIFYIWLMVRLALLLPSIAVEDALKPLSAFKLSGGHFWSLLGAFIILIILSFLIGIGFGVAAVIAAIIGMIPAALISGGDPTGGIAFFFGILPALLVYAVLYAVVGGAWLALPARAYADLTRDEREKAIIDQLDDKPASEKSEETQEPERTPDQG